jgi:hypothetical protein
MHSPLSLAVGYNRIVTHGRRSRNNVLATDLAGVLRGSGFILSSAALLGPPLWRGPSLCALASLALRGSSDGATMTTPGGAGTHHGKQPYNFLPRARRTGFSRRVGAPSLEGSGLYNASIVGRALIPFPTARPSLCLPLRPGPMPQGVSYVHLDHERANIYKRKPEAGPLHGSLVTWVSEDLTGMLEG